MLPSLKQYKKIEKNAAPKEAQGQSLSKDLARADDDGFANAKEIQRYFFAEESR